MSVIQKLPRDYVSRMREQLGEEAEAFFSSFEQEAWTGIRINTGKADPQELSEALPFVRGRIPWTQNGFYTSPDPSISRHPYYFAGLYYIQEPSAMLPASLLPVKPGDVVLDLCSAPGGKATELSSRLLGKGLLVANDISASRARALQKNLTLWGEANTCVTAETPEHLLQSFGCSFDKILVDAPCSGEGMFRKDAGLIRSWQERGPQSYAAVQKEILRCAVQMLRPGGMLLYSTCTFAPEEDEETVAWLLDAYPQLRLLPVPDSPGFAPGIRVQKEDGQETAFPLERCVRVYPHRVHGEGHFLALMQKRRRQNIIRVFWFPGKAKNPRKRFSPMRSVPFFPGFQRGFLTDTVIWR